MPPNVIDLTDASSSPTHTTPRKAQSTAPEGPEPTTSALLEQAICNASQSRLQHTLREICGVNPAASRTACDLLLVDNECVKYLSAEESSQEEDSSEAEEEEADEDDSTVNLYPKADGTPPKKAPTSTTSINSSLKRFRVRFATCENCSEEYDVSCNLKGDCIWHDGDLEENAESSTWDDWDQCHGPWDTTENREEFPEGFLWSCCDGDGTAEGCKTGRHIEKDYLAKRLRYS